MSAYWLLFFLPFLYSFSIIHAVFASFSLSVTDEQTNPGEASRQWEPGRYCMPFLASSTSPPPLLPSFFCSNPTNMLPVHINLTIICPIRRCPVPQRRLTARPGQTLQYSERIMLTVFLLAGVDPSSFRGVSSYALIHGHARTHTETCVSCHAWGENRSLLFCQTPLMTLSETNTILFEWCHEVVSVKLRWPT